MNIIGCLDTPTKGSYVLSNVDVSRMNDDDLAAMTISQAITTLAPAPAATPFMAQITGIGKLVRRLIKGL